MQINVGNYQSLQLFDNPTVEAQPSTTGIIKIDPSSMTLDDSATEIEVCKKTFTDKLSALKLMPRIVRNSFGEIEQMLVAKTRVDD